MKGTLTDDYQRFLESKRVKAPAVGFNPCAINPMLFPFQEKIVDWATLRGRAAIFADCGMGKTPMQLEWAEQVIKETSGPVLLLTPLAVAEQTQREGAKFGIKAKHIREPEHVDPIGINIVNYERVHKFTGIDWAGIVLDESSILKAFDGDTRKMLTALAKNIPYRLACSATPAPNDLIELTNHAEFLGIMSGKEIIALFFKQDGNTTHQWRLKHHAHKDFYKWLASWAIAIRKPSDLGFSDDGFVLPPLEVVQHSVECESPGAMLFPVEALDLQERRRARKDSLADRVAKVAELVAAEPNEQWLIWCDLNAESEALTKSIPGAVEVRGDNKAEHKEWAAAAFQSGEIKVLVSKPSMFGWGLNFQGCARMVFTGLSDSYEQFYQAVRRCYRFGQKRPVMAHVVISEREGAVAANIQRKERMVSDMMDALVKEICAETEIKGAHKEEMVYREDTATGKCWTLHLGDSVQWLDRLEENSVGLSVFSPPFPGMYAYTNSPADMGNTKSADEFLEQFSFMIPKLLKVTKPGRLCAMHITEEPIFKGQAGYVGRNDVPGKLKQAMVDAGWINWTTVTIDKDPQLKATRTKEATLLNKTLCMDSTNNAMAMADYLIVFKKPGDNEEPVRAGSAEKYNAGGGWITFEEWCEWAAPVWHRQHKGLPGGIRETDVLNVSCAREEKDERHLCPLQLGVIERCVKLWSNPGDLVLSPFAGIGSEGYMSLKLFRQFVGIELKESYWRQAQKYLTAAENTQHAIGLFDEAGA